MIRDAAISLLRIMASVRALAGRITHIHSHAYFSVRVDRTARLGKRTTRFRGKG
jgi:hypothetical protein